MMMGGIFGKKKYRYGDPETPVDFGNGWTPPIRGQQHQMPDGSMMDGPPMGSGQGMPPQSSMEQPERKGPSFLNRGLDFASGVADTLIQMRGGPATHSLAKQRAAQQQFAEAQYQRKRTDDYADWERQKTWERDNPKPVNNDTVNDIEFFRGEVAAGKMTPQQYDTWYQNNVIAPKYFTGQDGNRYQEGGGVPTKPVGKLTPIGGGAGNGAGNFPR
jgi:hypothetical protein